MGCIALWMLFSVRSVNLNFLCRFSVWWNLRILLSHSCWMFCTAYKNKVYLIHSAHVRAKRAEICFLASTLTSVNVGAILEIAWGIKTQIRPALKPDVLVTQRQHARASTRRFRVQTQERGTWKGTCLYCDITSRGKQVTGNFKKTLQFADTMKRNSTEFLPWVPQASHGIKN